ncbi:hypothetical protein HGRIS_014577 [Hohenbuehelia grisea]|uniref:DUF6534 domain-containing protein n=1 Tax=Hohenbuehelia grisea TaxID=104357 RepID=A0ABR3JTV7_9AGAR
MPSALDLNLGSLEIGVLLSSTLFGITTVQLYMYYQNRYKDPWWIRSLVMLVWLMEALHTIFAWVYLYRLTVTFYGQPQMLTVAHWTLNISAAFDGIIGAIVQAYFAWRVHVLSRGWTITVVSWIGSLLQMGLTLAVAGLASQYSVPEFHEKFAWIVTAALAFNLFVDVVNTTGLCFYLKLERSGFTRTDRMLDTLFVWSIQTGLPTVIGAILMLVFSLVSQSALWIGVSLFYAKLYSNSFLATLNGRKHLQTMMGKVNTSLAQTPPTPRHVQVTVTRDYNTMEMGNSPNATKTNPNFEMSMTAIGEPEYKSAGVTESSEWR